MPAHVKAFTTTRAGGVSLAPFDSNNLGAHVGDSLIAVTANRQQLNQLIPNDIIWLDQTHSTDIIDIVPLKTPQNSQGDAAYTTAHNTPCCVMTADCLPVLITNRAGDKIAAVHGGWRGLAEGILEKAIARFNEPAINLIVWLGPAIGPEKFEVGRDVVDIFVVKNPKSRQCFTSHGQKYLADIYQLARLSLNECDVTNISGGNHCTVSETSQFFSYRRDRNTGRMASVIWIDG